MQQISYELRQPQSLEGHRVAPPGSLCDPHFQNAGRRQLGSCGVKKSDSSLGVAAQGNRALPGSQGHEISSSEQAEAKNSLPMQTRCFLRVEFWARMSRVAPLIWAQAHIIRGQGES